MSTVMNRQPELYFAALIPYTAAAVALALRIISRHTLRKPLVWEDFLAMLAFAIGTGFTFISVYKTRWGLGKRIADIDLPMTLIEYHYFLDLWIDMWFYTFSVGLSKFVILGFYWRTFSSSIIRQPIRILFAGSGLWIIARVVLILMQCQPIRKFWHHDIPGYCPLTPMMSLFATGIPHFILEVAILLCPLIEIWRLHLPLGRKIAVAAMFASGLLVCFSAMGTIIHTVKLDKQADSDLTWDGLDDQIWAVCDVNLSSFATSLPLLRPVFRSFSNMCSVKFSRPSGHSVDPNVQRTIGTAPSSKRSMEAGTCLTTLASRTDTEPIESYSMHDLPLPVPNLDWHNSNQRD